MFDKDIMLFSLVGLIGDDMGVPDYSSYKTVTISTSSEYVVEEDSMFFGSIYSADGSRYTLVIDGVDIYDLLNNNRGISDTLPNSSTYLTFIVGKGSTIKIVNSRGYPLSKTIALIPLVKSGGGG